jgi:hypothetical protein
MKYAALKAGEHFRDWRLVVERRDGDLHILENHPLNSKEYSPETKPRPAAHNHENEMPARPVLGFDLHRTLTPDYGYPLLQGPWPGVKSFMDRMVARNCCLHIMTASLDFPDPQVVDARKEMVRSWALQNGIPANYIGVNVEANVRLDDRGITVSSTDTTAPDWDALGKQAEKALLDTWYIDPDDGCYYKREDVKPVGDSIQQWPEITDTPPDAPRGWTTPFLDIDIHRTINPGWGSTREDKPISGSVQAIQGLYAQGFQIQLSCAGWMRSTHTQAQSDQRLAAFRLYMRKYGIPFDRIVTKDDVDVWFDDKVIGFKNWKQALPDVTAALMLSINEHPKYAAGPLAMAGDPASRG